MGHEACDVASQRFNRRVCKGWETRACISAGRWRQWRPDSPHRMKPSCSALPVLVVCGPLMPESNPYMHTAPPLACASIHQAYSTVQLSCANQESAMHAYVGRVPHRTALLSPNHACMHVPHRTALLCPNQNVPYMKTAASYRSSVPQSGTPSCAVSAARRRSGSGG